MYRKTSKYRQNTIKSYSNKIDKEQDQAYDQRATQQVPSLRRVIEITDYDTGTPIHHKVELYKTDRIDCYDVVIDGELWKRRIGWSRILSSIRKAMPRLSGS